MALLKATSVSIDFFILSDEKSNFFSVFICSDDTSKCNEMTKEMMIDIFKIQNPNIFEYFTTKR